MKLTKDSKLRIDKDNFGYHVCIELGGLGYAILGDTRSDTEEGTIKKLQDNYNVIVERVTEE